MKRKHRSYTVCTNCPISLKLSGFDNAAMKCMCLHVYLGFNARPKINMGQGTSLETRVMRLCVSSIEIYGCGGCPFDVMS